jgi:transmembrane sensor
MRMPEPQSPQRVQAEAAARWCVRLCEGQMTSAARVEFTRWLTTDPGHRAAFDQAVAAWEEVSAAESTPGLVALRVEALDSLRQAQRARAGRLPRAGKPWLLAAASVLIAVFGIAAWWYLAPQQFSSGIAERRTVPLSDGSLISLDASSEVRVRYSPARRTLDLVRGRAKFNVAKDPGRPFSVQAADREIVATGTAVSVEILQKEVRVILYEGHVSVVGPSGSTPLSAGQELIAPASPAQGRIQPMDASRSLAWENGRLEFVDEPLAFAVERVNRYARNPVLIGDSTAASVRLSGVFTAGDTRAFIEGVTSVSPLRAEERNGREVLLPSALPAP